MRDIETAPLYGHVRLDPDLFRLADPEELTSSEVIAAVDRIVADFDAKAAGLRTEMAALAAQWLTTGDWERPRG